MPFAVSENDSVLLLTAVPVIFKKSKLAPPPVLPPPVIGMLAVLALAVRLAELNSEPVVSAVETPPENVPKVFQYVPVRVACALETTNKLAPKASNGIKFFFIKYSAFSNFSAPPKFRVDGF